MKSPQSLLIAAIALAALIAAAPPAKADNGRIKATQLLAQNDKDKPDSKSDAKKKEEKEKEKKKQDTKKHDRKDKQQAKPQQQQRQQRKQTSEPARHKKEATQPDSRSRQREDAARRKQREDAAQRKQHEDAARRKQRDEAVQRKQRKDAEERKQREEAAQRKQRDEAAQRKQRKDAEERKQRDEAAQRKQRDEAAQRKQRKDAEERKQREEAAQRKQREEDADRRKRREDAAKRKQRDNEPSKTLAVPAQQNQPRDSKQFIRRANEKPSGGLNELRKQRQHTREGNREVIREGDRTIEREHNRAIIRHDEAKRFAVGARRVDVERHGAETFSIVLRPDGIRIINVTDRNGRLVRRLRRDARGRDFILFDSGSVDPRHRGDLFVNVRPPRFRDHRRRRYVDAGRSDFALIFDFLTAGPFERPDRYYTVDQVRYSYPLREYMPRVDLDVNFDSGSWQLTPDQIGHLSVIARALNRAIERNPRELFMIEGHTDAVGAWEDNLSLSDRRAETVAVVLTEEFGVPPENLITQGYGEEHLKVPTPGPSRENRRVAVRRITPLVAHR